MKQKGKSQKEHFIEALGKITKAKLAKHAGISIPYLSQLENNERSGSKTILKKLQIL